jgi:polar amino acid transport system substrate-binding protein
LKRLSAAVFSTCFLLMEFTSFAADLDLAKKSTLNAVLSRGELRVGFDAGYMPFGMTDKSGGYIGFDIDLGRELSEAIGVKFVPVSLKIDDIIPALLTGKIDVIVGGMTITQERNLMIAFSDPYFVTGQTVLLNKKHEGKITSLGQLNDPKYTITTCLGTTGEKAVKSHLAEAKLEAFVNQTDGALEVVKDRADAWVFDMPFNIIFYAEYGKEKVVHLDHPFTYEPLGIGILHGDPDFLNFINNFLYRFKADGRYERIHKKWITHTDWFEQVPQRRADEEGIILIGSNTLVPLAQRLAEEWMRLNPGGSVSVSGGSSERGIKAVQDGAAHIGLVSMPMKRIEAAQRKGYPPLTVYRISLDAVVPVIHAANTLSALNVGQLRSIFAGDIRNWKDLGGPNAPIEVLTDDRTTGTYEVLRERVLGANRVIVPDALVTNTDAMLRMIAARPRAIGYVAYSRLDANVKALGINGVAPTKDNLVSGLFPGVRSLKFVTAPNPGDNVRRFMDFCLAPEHGGRIQQELGMIPCVQNYASAKEPFALPVCVDKP